MNAKEIEISVRRSLKRVFPNTVWQVTYHNGTVDLDLVGGKRYDNRYTDAEILSMIVDAIRETLPDYQHEEPEYTGYSLKLFNE